jgi:hypothetical protein
MTRSNFFAVTFSAIACTGYLNSSANAGWFGPSSYDECMIEQMRGQPANMGQIAGAVCLKKFPPKSVYFPEPAPQETLLDSGKITYRRCDENTSDGRVALCVDNKPSSYKISKVKFGIANSNPCQHNTITLTVFPYNVEDDKYWTYIDTEKKFFRDIYVTITQPINYNCWDVRFYGFFE